MVKADPKHDYYADLEVPVTADAETIKKQFRLLAKQYHPDRNPGREIEVIPKFQAIQAANEILSDPTQKRNYDRDRAKESQTHDTPGVPTFKKPGKPPPPASNFPPPPKRNPNPPKPSFGASNTRPTSSASAEKFAQFTRQAPQQWDRAKFEDAAKAETLRNLNNMRGQSQGPPPRVPPRAAPTAPRPSSTAPSPDPGFPGLSRTNSGRRGGFTPNNPSSDEPPAPSSAYAYVHRPPPPFPYPSNNPKNSTSASPSASRTRPSMSPLRPVKSSGFEDVQRPGLSRTSSRYATHSGEKTDINGPGLTRSASVRNSPTSQHWEDSGPFGRRPQSQQHGSFPPPPPPRHHSSSPRGRSAKFELSGSESTSSNDEEPPRNDNRPKVTPRRNQPPPSATSPHNTHNEPAVTGSFQFGNYNTKSADEKQYHYPPPEPNTAPNRRNFGDASNPVDDITQGLNKSGIRHVHRDDVPPTNQSSQRPNGTSSEPQPAAPNANNTFSAAEWDGKFANGENVFRPPEPTSRSRSPTKTPRPKLPNRNKGVNRSQGEKESDGSAGDESTPSMPGVRHVPGTSEREVKAAAFQPGKFSAEDWAQRLRGQSNSKGPKTSSREKAPPDLATKQPQVHDEVEVEEHPSSPEQVSVAPKTNGPDPMEIDDSTTQQVPPARVPNDARPASDSTPPRPTSVGVNLSELKNTAPFRPSATGLADLNDLGNELPFESRAAEELNLHQAPSSGLAAHHLRLPPPPKPVLPPDEAHLDQESWSAYSHKMTQYIDAWNIFNCKMIDHFRVRQQQIHLAMYHNWVTAIGDGAAADDFEGLDYVGTESGQANGTDVARSKSKKAGYATYMEWLKQDRMCRTWWEVAFEEHTKCMEDLGRVRRLVKTIFVRETRKTA